MLNEFVDNLLVGDAMQGVLGLGLGHCLDLFFGQIIDSIGNKILSHQSSQIFAHKQKDPVPFEGAGSFFIKKVLFSFLKTKETLGNPAQLHRICLLPTQKPLSSLALN